MTIPLPACGHRLLPDPISDEGKGRRQNEQKLEAIWNWGWEATQSVAAEVVVFGFGGHEKRGDGGSCGGGKSGLAIGVWEGLC